MLEQFLSWEDEPPQSIRRSPFVKATVRRKFTIHFFLLLSKQFSIIYMLIYLCYTNDEYHEYVKHRILLWIILCCLFVALLWELSHEGTLKAILNFGYTISVGLTLTALILITKTMSPFLAVNQSSMLCLSFVLYLSFPKAQFNMVIVFLLWVAITLLYGSFAYTNRGHLDLWSDCLIASVCVLLCSLFIFSCVRSMTYEEYFYSVDPNEFIYPSVTPIPFVLLAPMASIALFYIVKLWHEML